MLQIHDLSIGIRATTGLDPIESQRNKREEHGFDARKKYWRSEASIGEDDNGARGNEISPVLIQLGSVLESRTRRCSELKETTSNTIQVINLIQKHSKPSSNSPPIPPLHPPPPQPSSPPSPTPQASPSTPQYYTPPRRHAP